MEKKLYERPLTDIVVVTSELLQQLPGASYIKNGDDETPTPITPSDPSGGIGAKDFYEDSFDDWE